MSAITLEYPLAEGERGVVPSAHGRRGALRLVSSQPAAAAMANSREGRASRRPMGGVRITRRGRLALTMAGAALLALMALTLSAHLSGASTLDVDHATVVRSGQTLSEVAAEQLPGVSLRESVPALQSANGMSGTAVIAGQTLLVPRLG